MTEVSRRRRGTSLGAIVATGASALAMFGCVVGPNFRRPAPPDVAGYTRPDFRATTASSEVAGGEEQKILPGGDVSGQWWTLFQSPPLNSLIDKALQANPTLLAADAALRQAMELVRAQQGSFYPKADASFSPSYQKSSATLAPPLNIRKNDSDPGQGHATRCTPGR